MPKKCIHVFQIPQPAHTVDPPVRGKCSTVHRITLHVLIRRAPLLFVLTQVACIQMLGSELSHSLCNVGKKNKTALQSYQNSLR